MAKQPLDIHSQQWDHNTAEKIVLITHDSVFRDNDLCNV